MTPQLSLQGTTRGPTEFVFRNSIEPEGGCPERRKESTQALEELFSILLLFVVSHKRKKVPTLVNLLDNAVGIFRFLIHCSPHCSGYPAWTGAVNRFGADGSD
jgi:hypothetical protein